MDILAQFYGQFRSVFWSETFWFPHNSTWKDFQDQDVGPYKDVNHPRVGDLYVVFPVTVALLVVRYLLEHVLLQPLAGICGLKRNKQASRQAENVPELNAFFKQSRRPQHVEMERLAKELSWPIRRVQRWFRIKRNHRKSCGVKKFCEAGWRFIFYFCAYFCGLYVLHDEDFAWDWSLTRAMEHWPHHHARDEFYYYYILEIGFYVSLFVTMLKDVRRSDFLAMSLHHLLTIALLVFSWTINMVRVGLIILILHDAADYWLEMAKIAMYLRKEKLAAVLILTFASVWIITRVYLYPVHIVYPSWVAYIDWYSQFGHCLSVLTQLAFLSCIVVLNLIWTYFILKTIYDIFSKGDTKDARSDSELSDISSDEVCDRNGHSQNGDVKAKYH